MLAVKDHGGTGPALVLVHGLLGSGVDWQPVLLELKKHYRCITVDLPGHGDSRGCAAITGLDDLAHLLHRTLINTFTFKRFTLLGYSLGGRVAMAYAAHYPETLERLFLEGAHPGLEDDDERLLRRQQDKDWAQRFANEPLPRVLYDWYQQPVFASMTGLTRSALVMERSADDSLGDGSGFTQSRGALIAEILVCCGLAEQIVYRDLLKYFSSTMFPIAYLVGEMDHKFRQLAAALTQNSDIDMRIVKGAGHNAHRDNPAAFVTALLP